MPALLVTIAKPFSGACSAFAAAWQDVMSPSDEKPSTSAAKSTGSMTLDETSGALYGKMPKSAAMPGVCVWRGERCRVALVPGAAYSMHFIKLMKAILVESGSGILCQLIHASVLCDEGHGMVHACTHACCCPTCTSNTQPCVCVCNARPR